MIDLSDCLAIGKITKAHGIRGQVVLRLDNLHFDDILNMEPVYLLIEGLPVPFIVLEYAERTADSLLVSFDDIDTTEGTKEILEAEVYLPKICISSEHAPPPQFDKFIGYLIQDREKGEIGRLSEIIDLKDNPLLQIQSRKKEILIPLQDEFLLDIDDINKIIHVDIPKDLLDLNS